MRLVLGLAFCLVSEAAVADTVVPLRVIRAKSVITSDAVRVNGSTIAGAFSIPEEVIGLEARVALYPGRPIRVQDVGAPALIERNQIVELVYQSTGLKISTEGRSLGRAAVGETLRVMNLSSRTTVSGVVQADRSVHVWN